MIKKSPHQINDVGVGLRRRIVLCKYYLILFKEPKYTLVVMLDAFRVVTRFGFFKKRNIFFAQLYQISLEQLLYSSDGGTHSLGDLTCIQLAFECTVQCAVLFLGERLHRFLKDRIAEISSNPLVSFVSVRKTKDGGSFNRRFLFCFSLQVRYLLCP